MHYGRTLKFLGFVPALSAATLLTACGGGSSATSTTTTTAAAATTSDVVATSAVSASTEGTAETSTVTATNAVSDASSGSPSGPGATQVFSYPNGFASAGSAVRTAWAAGMVGSAIDLTDVTTVHAAGGAWYTTQQNVGAFTTDFTFQIPAGGYGITFAVQNSTEAEEGTPPWSGGSPYGTNASGDANMLGYGSYNYPTQYPIRSSIGVKFDASAGNNLLLTPKKSSATGLYINGGPVADLLPQVDMQGSGINVGNGDVMAAHFVYDGSVLTMVLRDTVTNAQFRTSWPVNIASITGSAAYFGFTGGTIPVAAQEILSWSFSEGYAQRLPTPTFSVASGSYTSQQTVSISAYTGSTIYYTTNGQQPTSSSTQYTGPITVSSNEVVQAVAIENGYTDSLVGAANYQIQPAASPLINFPSGFTNGGSSLISVNGTAQFSGSAIELTDSSNALESGSAWYVVPVNVQSFTTSFTLQMQDAYTNGITFTIQNQNPGSTDSSNVYVTGGPNAVSNSIGLGYSGSTGAGGQNIGLQTSVAVKFDLTSAQANTTGLFTDGADTSTSGTQITGVNLAKGNPVNVTLSYNGTTLSMTMTDTVTNATFSTSWPINIPSTVSGNTAYVGFTAGTGWGTAPQQISNWTFSN